MDQRATVMHGVGVICVENGRLRAGWQHPSDVKVIANPHLNRG